MNTSAKPRQFLVVCITLLYHGLLDPGKKDGFNSFLNACGVSHNHCGNLEMP